MLFEIAFIQALTRIGPALYAAAASPRFAKPVQQLAQISSGMPQRLYRIKRVGEAVRAGGRRRELCDTCGSLRADSLRIEATFLPDYSGKELDRQGVLRRRLF